MPRSRHVRPLTEAEKAELEDIYKASPDFFHRQRAHAILLSDRGHSVGQVAEIFGVDRDTVSVWISRFENQGACALKNLPRSGRRPIYTDEEARQLKALVDEEPRRIKRAAGILQERTGKTSCLQTLRRLLKKKLKYSWHRCRRSMKTRRDDSLFEKERENQKAMSVLAGRDKIRLYYFDETGFSLEPSVPYAWQPVGGQAEIPSFKSKRLNVLGFLSKSHPASFHTVEGRVRSAEVVAAFDAFASGYAAEYRRHKIPCVVALDNATNHTSKEFCSQWDKWALMGVFVHYLPTYGSELNLIEILWRKIKYEWLPFSSYSTYDNLKKALQAILEGFGTEYQIKYV